VLFVCVCVCIARVSGALPLAKLLLIDADDANADDDDVPMPILPDSHAVAFYTRVRMLHSARVGAAQQTRPLHHHHHHQHLGRRRIARIAVPCWWSERGECLYRLCSSGQRCVLPGPAVRSVALEPPYLHRRLFSNMNYSTYYAAA